MTGWENILRFLTSLLNLLISIITLQAARKSKKNSSKTEEFHHQEKEAGI